MAQDDLSLYEQAGAHYLDFTKKLGTQAGIDAGRAPGMTQITDDAEELRHWMMKKPGADVILIAQGYIDQGMPVQQAQQNATLDYHPLRRSMLEQADIDPDDPEPVAKYAETMRQRLMKSMGVQHEVPPGYAPGPANPNSADLGMTPGPAPTRPQAETLPEGVIPGPAPTRPTGEEPVLPGQGYM